MMDTNEKLASWRWPECDETEQSEIVRYESSYRMLVIDRDGNIVYNGTYFTSSLDACFEWLVPKVLARGLSLHVTASERGYLSAVYGGSQYHNSREETPALALCKAVEQLIDKEGSDA